MKQSNSQVGFDVLKDLRKTTRTSKRNNIVNVSQVKLEEELYNNILEEYECETDCEEVVDERKYITKIEGNFDRSKNSLENSCDVNFVENEKLDKESKERSVIRDKGKSKLQESLFIIPVKIRNKESRALIDSGAQSNFITPELVKELKLETEIAPEVVLTTVTGETSKTNRKVLFELEIGRPFTKRHAKYIVHDTVFGVMSYDQEDQTREVEYVNSNQFLRDMFY